jgi:hypothetical protein
MAVEDMPQLAFPDVRSVGFGAHQYLQRQLCPILGKRHPAALGQTGVGGLGGIWDVVRSAAEAVMQHGEATWNERVLLMMERNGCIEETYFTWSYSPIYDESGGIGGVFCAASKRRSGC